MFKKLIKWSNNNYTNLPWRKNRSVYTTLVSEIMLQQTTVGTVINHFDGFIKKYPSVIDLANSTEEEVCIAWKGLGYYRRARNLRNAAIDIVQNYQGIIPSDYNALVKIKGIGDYTASAIIAIGNDLPALAIDANLERVLARVFGVKEMKGPKLVAKLKELLLTPEFNQKKIKSFRELNESLMDLGRTFCQANKVSCELCPVSEDCFAFKNNKIYDLPVIDQEKKAKKAKDSHDLELLRVIVEKGDSLLGYVKGEKEWLTNQVEVPTFVLSTTDKSFSQYPKMMKTISTTDLVSIKTSITKYKIKNYILKMSAKEFQENFRINDYSFFKKSEKSNFSTATIKSLKKVSL